MENKLLPCPFCGGEAEVLSYEVENNIYDKNTLGYIDTEYRTLWSVGCSACMSLTTEKRNEAEAIEAWNTRVYRPCCPKPCTPSCWYEGVE